MDDNMDPDMALSDGDSGKEPVEESLDTHMQTQVAMDDNMNPVKALSDGDGGKEPVEEPLDTHMQTQVANIVSLAAYRDLMKIALESKNRPESLSSSSVESVNEFIQMFHSPPSPGMRVEFSVESAVIPLVPDVLISIIFKEDTWTSALMHLVSHVFVNEPPVVLQDLKTLDELIIKMSIVDAEFQLPTPFSQKRKFRFLRCLRRVTDEMWIIVDVSIDYFPQASDFISNQNSRRRPSGMIIRRREYHSEVLWIENVEVPECQTQDSIYNGIINSNMAFCAKVWVSTLIWGLKRNYRRRLVNTKIPMTNEVHTRMRKLTESMKMVYLDIVRGTPDETKWIRISKGDVRVMMYALENPDHLLGLINYMAVTSFRVQAEALSVFNFLVKKSVGLQRQASPNSREPEEVMKAVSGIDDSYCISLYDKGDGFILQEASRNGFCSFIISIPFNLADINSSVYDGQVLVLPSGFAIMADGYDASLVTIAVQQKIDVDESAQVIETMQNLITSIIREICEEIRTGSEHLAGSMEKLDLKK